MLSKISCYFYKNVLIDGNYTRILYQDLYFLIQMFTLLSAHKM